MDMVFNRLTDRARDVLARLEDNRRSAWDQRRDMVVDRYVYAAAIVIEAVTGDPINEDRAREVMARCYAEAEA